MAKRKGGQVDQEHLKRSGAVPISLTADSRLVRDGRKISALPFCGRSLPKGPRSRTSHI